MREMKQSGIVWVGQIPKGWQAKRLKFCIDKIDGGVWGNEPIENEQNAKVLRSTEQEVDGRFNIQTPAFRSLTQSEIQKALLKKDDLLMTKSSGSLDHIGKTSIVTREIEAEQYCFSNFMQRIKINKGNNAKYFFYGFNCPLAREQYDYLSTTTTGLLNLNAEMIRNVYFAIPPLTEQTTIANFLDDKCGKIDELITIQENAIAELKEYKKTIIYKATTKGISNAELKDSGVGYFGKIPSNWEIVRNKNLFTIRKEIVGEKFNEYQLLSLTQQGVVEKDIDLMGGNLPESFETYQRVPHNTIVIALFDISTRSTTISGWAKNEGMITSAYRVLIPNGKVNLAYYDYLFTHIGADRCYVSEGKNIRCSIDEDTFGAIKIICPPLSEQKAIAEYLDKKIAEVDNLIATKHQKIAELKEYKKSLIYEYVTGKKEVV